MQRLTVVMPGGQEEVLCAAVRVSLQSPTPNLAGAFRKKKTGLYVFGACDRVLYEDDVTPCQRAEQCVDVLGNGAKRTSSSPA